MRIIQQNKEKHNNHKLRGENEDNSMFVLNVKDMLICMQ